MSTERRTLCVGVDLFYNSGPFVPDSSSHWTTSGMVRKDSLSKHPTLSLAHPCKIIPPHLGTVCTPSPRVRRPAARPPTPQDTRDRPADRAHDDLLSSISTSLHRADAAVVEYQRHRASFDNSKFRRSHFLDYPVPVSAAASARKTRLGSISSRQGFSGGSDLSSSPSDIYPTNYLR